MSKHLVKLCSILLSFVMIFNMLPHQVLADTLTTEDLEMSSGITNSEVTQDVKVVEEDLNKRTEFIKEFKLNNGLQMAAVYATAVHYEEDGQWKEIDNTLVSKISNGAAIYTNTAGVWDVSFPAQLTSNNYVTVAKDGYTLKFGMAGVLSNSGTVVMGGDVSLMSIEDQLSSGTLAVQPVQASTAHIQQFDHAEELAQMEYPEALVTKNSSRIQYNNIAANTSIVYDMVSNTVKESIVIGRYDASLRGYRYNLDVGDLVPVLNDDNSIWFYDKDREEVVMVMPVPFLVDNEKAYNYDVDVVLQGSGSTYTLLYLLPVDWLSAEERAWPVVLDPVVSASLEVTNIRDISVTEKNHFDNNGGSLDAGYCTGNYNCIMRSYLKYREIPELSSADVVVYAQVGLYKMHTTVAPHTVEVHKVLSNWESESIKWATQPSFDPVVADYAITQAAGFCYWEVTDIVRSWYEIGNYGMMFKASDAVENAKVSDLAEFCSAEYGTTSSRPTILICYRNANGLESYWDYTTASAGRAGTAYVNDYTGNLVFVHSDIGFGGNRMPVSISHIYNANDSEANDFGMGYGWRTNFHQRVYAVSGDTNASYAWEDADGTKHYFVYDSETGLYKDEDGLELVLDDYLENSIWTYSITDKNGNVSYFGAIGRLGRMENNQATESSIDIEYVSTSNRIATIEDGLERLYTFTYSGNKLNRISYKGTGASEITYVTYGYDSSSRLTSITDADGKTVTYGYTSKNLLATVDDIDNYQLSFTYHTVAADVPSRVASISVSDGSALGGKLTFDYGRNQTTISQIGDNNGAEVIQAQNIIQFNNWGNTVAIQDSQGRAQYAQFANNDARTESGKGNQLTVSSKLQNTVGNMLSDNSFESGGIWTTINSSVSQSISSTAYIGSKSLSMTRSSAGTASGVYKSFTAAANSTYTFSAYVKTGSGTAYLALNDGSTTVTSETLAANSGWTRLQVSYTNSSSSAKTVTARLTTEQAGTVYMDCVQVEKAPTASRYNLIVNGDFWDTSAWSAFSGRNTVSPSAAPQLDTYVYRMTGASTAKSRIYQTVNVSGSAGDTFVLAGWAMGNSVALKKLNALDNTREFGLIAVFNYTDGTKSDEFAARFNTDVDNWQYSAAPIVAGKAYSSITVYLAYDYNANTVCFDGIQLYKEEFGNSYTYDEDGNVISVVDLQKQTTTYKYDSNNNLTQMLQDNVAKMTYTYDAYHNVLTATSAEGLKYTFAYDTYGNNTSVSISSGGVTMTSSAAYTSDGNRLSTTTDAAGNVTTYSYNANTNVLEWVQYPNSSATKTTYTYDTMYRLATASASTGTQTLSASYTYENDLLTKLTTGSTTYNFTYGNFGLRSSIKVGSTTLATYTYTSRNNYLQTLAYGNSDSVQYTYDSLGRVTKETYEDGDTVSYAYDNDGALATVTDSATGRKTTYYYDFTDRLMKYVEQGSGYSHSVGYTYDTLNNLTQIVETINGTDRTTSYTYDEDNRVIMVSEGPAGTTPQTTRDYIYDPFGRVSSRVTKHNGSTISTDTITYRTVSGKATGQVASLANKAGTFTYTYDANGNIKTVSFGGKTTTYTYDNQNQLTREDNQAAGKTWVWTYDDAGNILSKKEYAYTTGTLGSVLSTVSYGYGNSNWGDLLTSWGGKTISSDAIGNMTSDGTWAYTWEHGRELAGMAGMNNDGTENEVTITYTYDANGLRTGKTVTVNTYHTHSYSTSVTAPTCTAGGYTTYTCACGHSYQGNQTAAVGHSYSSVVTAPTCTANGYTTYTCSVCNHSYTGAETTATGHNYTSTVVESTCTATGYTVYTCTECGHSYQGNETPEAGHGYTSIVTAPTCVAAGYTTHTCSVCGHSYQDNETAATGHNYAAVVIDPICTEGGYTISTCSNCQESYVGNETNPLGHHYVEELDPNGNTIYACFRCGKLGSSAHVHSYVFVRERAATCTLQGVKYYECSTCGATQVETSPALGHNYNDNGIITMKCTRCGQTKGGIGVLTTEELEEPAVTGAEAEAASTDNRVLESTVTTTYSYVYNGGQLAQETITTTVTEDGTTTTTTDVLNYIYDASGPMAVDYNGDTYYYVTNLQGDIVAILNSSGTSVVTYTYDAWGNHLTTAGTLSSTLGEANALRYRGYVFDTESELYYLQSRYYSPAMGRFLSHDIVFDRDAGLQGYDLFIYCGNNPVNRIDISGADSNELSDGEDMLDKALLEGGGGKGGGGSPGSLGNQSNGGFDILSEILCLLDMFGQTLSAELGGLAGNIRTTPYTPVCFVAGTLIHAQDRLTPIEQIQAGDMVWAWNEETGEIALKEVVETYVNETSELVHIFVNGEEIVATPAHPFYSSVKGWTAAAKLRAGDVLSLINGESVAIEKIQHETLEKSIPVYNFQVEDYHTYYVLGTGVLVHNVCSDDIYNSVRESPAYDDGFVKERNGTKKVNMNNGQLKEELNLYGKGWKKVYSDGYLYGEQVSMHYFQSSTGQVYNVKYKEGWSVLVGG